MATTCRLSPAATLLRNSRLFSIPPPLEPPVSLTSATATLPYPTHAAIETPSASWAQGDWGFKRNLPIRTTVKRGTTTIRVQNGIDSQNNVADFEPAADHVLTLQKLKELNLPIRLIRRTLREPSLSAFDPSLDNTRATATPGSRRWRYEGPWLAGQNEMQFEELLKAVRDRKAEFRVFVRERVGRDKQSSRREKAIAAGEVLTSVETASVSEKELDDYFRYLRTTPMVMGPLIAEFLDLPEGPPAISSSASPKEDFTYGRSTVAAESFLEMGPPQTHPSGGVSYFRSGAHLPNHPVYGPQQQQPPARARIIRPSIRRKSPEVGIAGCVISPATVSQLMTVSQPWKPNPGGAKMIVRPTTAAVDTDGKIILSAERTNTESIKVYGMGQPEKLKPPPPIASTRFGAMPKLDQDFSRDIKPLHDSLEKMLRESGPGL